MAGALVGLVFAVLLYRNFGPGTTVSAQLAGFEALSDDRVRVDVQVAREPGTDAYCVLRARGADGAEVGRTQADVPDDPDRQTVLRAEFPTTARAVVGELVGCAQGRAEP